MVDPLQACFQVLAHFPWPRKACQRRLSSMSQYSPQMSNMPRPVSLGGSGVILQKLAASALSPAPQSNIVLWPSLESGGLILAGASPNSFSRKLDEMNTIELPCGPWGKGCGE